MKFNSYNEAASAWAADKEMWAAQGVTLPEVRAYAFDAAKRDYTIAMDAQPTLNTDPNSAVPWTLTNMIDPTIFEVLFAPTKAAEVAGEVRKGTFVMDTVMFPVVEHTGEVTSYDDYANGGMTNANVNWPQRQQYRFQTVKKYGELELERAGLGRINWVQELDVSAANNINRFINYSYLYGISGLQNYGLLNDPNLPASITPATKAYGGTTWYQSGVVKATANEIFLDVEDTVNQLISQANGLVDSDSKLTIALSPLSYGAFSTTNSFNVNVKTLIKDNYPNARIVTVPQYGVQSTSNSQGLAAGNFMQIIADTVEGQQTAFCAFGEKMRAFPIIRLMSAFEQKVAASTWGTVIRAPIFIAGMLGI